YFAARPGREFRILSIEFPSVMGWPPHVLPSHVNVELDVAPIRTFIQRTNCVVMESHGVTTLGRSLSEAYHRLNTLAAEVRRLSLAEELAALRGTEIQYVDATALEWAYEHADDVIYPTPAAARAAQATTPAAGPPADPLPHQPRPRRQRRQLLIALIPRRPAEATVGVYRQLLGRTDLEHAPDPARHVLGRVLVEALHVDDAR